MATNILVECPSLIASVKVGVLNCLKLLEKQCKCCVRFVETIRITSADIRWCDVLITVRGCEAATLYIVKRAKKFGRFIIYYLDDDLLNVPLDKSCPPMYYNQVIKKNLTEIIHLSDVLWGVNIKLCDKYRKYVSTGRSVINKVPYKAPNLSCFQNNKPRVLYAGSTSHTFMVQEYLSPVIRRLSGEYPEVEFFFIGADSGIYDRDNVTNHPIIEDYDKYREFVENKGFNIGLAVVKTDEFFQCKYYNKFLEYTSIGCAGVYTDTLPYTYVVKDCKNGLLCKNDPESWYKSIKNLINDADLRAYCFKNAYDYINTEHNAVIVSQKLQNDLPELCDYKADRISRFRIVLLPAKAVFIISRCKETINENGLFNGLCQIICKGLKVIKRCLSGENNV